MLWDTVRKQNPLMVNFECMSQLQQSIEGSQSDPECIIQNLENAGCWAQAEVIHAEEFGAPGPRARLYWVGLSGLQGDAAKIKHLFNSVLVGCKQSRSFQVMGDLLTASDELRRLQAASIKQPVFEQYGAYRELKYHKESVTWKVDPKLIFDANNLMWPVDFGRASCTRADERLHFHGLLPREVEAAYFLHRVWPMPCHVDAQSLDINPNLRHILKTYLSEDAHRPTGSGTPWRLHLPTLIGSVKVVVRYRLADIVAMRTSEGFEYMRLTGWSDDMWSLDHMVLAETREVECPELLANMSGNA